MNEQQWYSERDDRTLRYARRVLPPNRWILLCAEATYAERYDGQVAILTAANLLGRMTPAVAIDIPDVRIVAPLPWAGQKLQDFILAQLYAADPFGRFECRAYRSSDYVLRLGLSGVGEVAHGTGWNAYIGPTPSPLAVVNDLNPIGPAFAAIIAAANLFIHEFAPPSRPFILNTLTWSHELTGPETPILPTQPDLGDLWTVGTGSVGTVILYFLTLATPHFSTALFDMDTVKRHNLDRSPIFTAKHLGQYKVHVVSEYLKAMEVINVTVDNTPLDQSTLWQRRPPGTPDVLISAANERNVRHVIETRYPPIQIYGTTGKNWQASVIRHTLFKDPCSCCLFPNTDYVPTSCATGEIPESDGEEQVDAAIPFLSFAAGAMAASEILKLVLPGFPFSTNRVTLCTKPWPRIAHASLYRRPECICRHLSAPVHRKMIEGSQFASLSH